MKLFAAALISAAEGTWDAGQKINSNYRNKGILKRPSLGVSTVRFYKKNSIFGNPKKEVLFF